MSSTPITSLLKSLKREVGRVALSCHLSMDSSMPKKKEGCVQKELKLVGSPSFHCVQRAWKKGGGVLMPSFRPLMRGLACGLRDSFEHFVRSSE